MARVPGSSTTERRQSKGNASAPIGVDPNGLKRNHFACPLLFRLTASRLLPTLGPETRPRSIQHWTDTSTCHRGFSSSLFRNRIWLETLAGSHLRRRTVDADLDLLSESSLPAGSALADQDLVFGDIEFLGEAANHPTTRFNPKSKTPRNN